MRKALSAAFIAVLSLAVTSCASNDEAGARHFGIFKVSDSSKTIEMDGVVATGTLADFEELYQEYPDVNQLNIVNCDGSEDDETNLMLARKIHDSKISTHVMDGGVVASGGVDLFLAGTKRTVGKNVRIGVHSWADAGVKATDYPKGHEEHRKYIEYYKSIGFDQQSAEGFYYFTIYAASPSGIHYMTEDEMAKYKVLTE
ncbi:MAG: hypothetical protein CSA84_01490 [Actinomycetales bacterium]|nr:MAG: hypothetical protein CSA84_01490 [Actinomycetales bacterium]